MKFKKFTGEKNILVHILTYTFDNKAIKGENYLYKLQICTNFASGDR